jgi:hypothetical protein
MVVLLLRTRRNASVPNIATDSPGSKHQHRIDAGYRATGLVHGDFAGRHELLLSGVELEPQQAACRDRPLCVFSGSLTKQYARPRETLRSPGCTRASARSVGSPQSLVPAFPAKPRPTTLCSKSRGLVCCCRCLKPPAQPLETPGCWRLTAKLRGVKIPKNPMSTRVYGKQKRHRERWRT